MKKLEQPRKIQCEEFIDGGMNLKVLKELIEIILARDPYATFEVCAYEGPSISYYRFETPEEVEARVQKDREWRKNQKDKKKLEKELKEKIERATLKRLQEKYGCDNLEDF